MRTKGSIEIDCPIDETFRLTTNNVAEWSTIVFSDEVLNSVDNGGVGTTFRTVTKEHGRELTFEGRVTKHDPPTAHSIYITGDSFDIDIDYTFEELSGRTRVTQDSSVMPKGFLKVFFALFGWAMKRSNCKALDAELNSLKRFCEDASQSAASP